MLWLPLQSTTAAVLSLCIKGEDNAAIKLTTLATVPVNVPTLPGAQEKYSSDKSDKSIATASDQHHTHQPLTKHSSDEVTSNLQCNNVFCQINYTALVLSLSPGLLISLSGSNYIPLFTSGFISFVPEQLQRPPIT